VRLTLVANPGSGRDTDPDVLAAALRERGAEVDAYPIDAVEEAGRAAAGSDRLVVAGGDGSIGVGERAATGGGIPPAAVLLGGGETARWACPPGRPRRPASHWP
jgi:diacylglycerol kinase (ATP)